MRARPFGVEVIEILRVEAGLVVLDYDYQAHERTPYDLSFDRVVALGTVDFLGSDALKAVAANPPRRFKTLRLEGEELPEYGVEVRRAGQVVGTLTSPALSPRSVRSPWPSSMPTWLMTASGSRWLSVPVGNRRSRSAGYLRSRQEAATPPE